jgi:hypothetical protein
MTPESIELAALADPHARPLTDTDFQRMKQTPQAN